MENRSSSSTLKKCFILELSTAIDLSTAHPPVMVFMMIRIACLNTYYNMKAISPHYNITDELSD